MLEGEVRSRDEWPNIRRLVLLVQRGVLGILEMFRHQGPGTNYDEINSQTKLSFLDATGRCCYSKQYRKLLWHAIFHFNIIYNNHCTYWYNKQHRKVLYCLYCVAVYVHRASSQ